MTHISLAKFFETIVIDYIIKNNKNNSNVDANIMVRQSSTYVNRTLKILTSHG